MGPGSGEKAVVLLSGGLDSATVLTIAQAEGWECYALTVSYGQRHEIEITRAIELANHLAIAEHRMMEVNLSEWGGSSLIGDGEVPLTNDTNGSDTARIDPSTTEIPSTYVPARNTVLLSLALAWAEVIEARAIFLGVSAVDYSGYPDCRPEFIQSFQQVANVATRAGLASNGPVIRAPLINKSKAETIRWGISLDLDFGLTWSCYNPVRGPRPCGKCDSCRLRARGFAEAGFADPLLENDGGNR